MASTNPPVGQLARECYPGFSVNHPDANPYVLATRTGTIIDLVGTATTPTATDTDVNATNNTITLTNHMFGTVDGAGPIQFTSTGTLPAGLSTGTNYWIIRTGTNCDQNTVAFATTLALAIAKTKVDITGAGTVGATITLTPWNPAGRWQFTDSEVSVAANTVTSTAHSLGTGDGPVRLLTTGVLPTGLSTGTDYWIIRSSATAVQFATSLANAYLGTAVDITALAGTTGAGLHEMDYPYTFFSMRYTGTGSAQLGALVIALNQPIGSTVAKHILVEAYTCRSFTASDSGGTALTLTGNAFKVRTADASTTMGNIQIATTIPIAAGTRTPDLYPFGNTGGATSTSANAVITGGAGNNTMPTSFGPILVANEGIIVQVPNYSPFNGLGSYIWTVTCVWIEYP